MRLLSENPAKRRVETIVLAWSPIWIVIIGALMGTRRFARWDDGEHLALGLALALPLWLAPFAWPAPDEKLVPLAHRHAARFTLFVALMTFVQTWFGTRFFFDHLGMEYHFRVTWILRGTPLFLYFVTIAYFSTYYVVMQVALRALRSLWPGAPWPVAVGARAIVSYLVAFAETAGMASPLIREFFLYRDKAFAMWWGSLCYGTVFFVSLPILERLDERPGDAPPSLRTLARDVLAANLLALFLYDLYAAIMAARGA